MRCVAALFVLVLALGLAGCGGADPFCGDIDDMAGTPLIFCRQPRQVPVCDAPGDMARFEPDEFGDIRLMGGTPATCSRSDRQPTCGADGGTPRCITDPQL